MFCRICGKEMPDCESFCTHCGHYARAKAEANFYKPEEPTEAKRVKDALSASILTFGILSLVFTVEITFLSIVFGHKTKKKAADFVRQFGELDARASVGLRLGKIGFLVGLISTVALVANFQFMMTLLILIALLSV